MELCITNGSMRKAESREVEAARLAEILCNDSTSDMVRFCLSQGWGKTKYPMADLASES